MAYVYDFLKKLVLPFHYYRKALEKGIFEGQKKGGGHLSKADHPSVNFSFFIHY